MIHSWGGGDFILKKGSVIAAAGVLVCLGLYGLEQGFRLSYGLTSPIKLLLFIGVPILIDWLVCGDYTKTLGVAHLKGVSLKKGLSLGMASALGLLAVYWILSGFIDLKHIADELTTHSGILPQNFIFVGLYIIVVNAWIEEFFFRGFLFLSLQPFWGVRRSAFFSALLFSMYHLTIFATWFSSWLLGVALIGLFGVGLFFIWLNLRSETIWNSWLVHALADAAIVFIGFLMFGLL